MWDQFLLAIDYKNSTLRDQKPFKASDVDKLDTNEKQLEQDLCSNLHALVTEGNSHEQFEDNDLATSNYLTLDDFIHFLILPFVVVSLILEDQLGLDSFHDALFEKTNNNEYGDLFFPEDIIEPSVHTIHYQNMLSNRSAQDLRDTEPHPSPPRHHKSTQIKTEAKTETLKIRIPRRPSLKRRKSHWMIFNVSPKTRSDKPSVKANTVNPSSYETRSRSKAKERWGLESCFLPIRRGFGCMFTVMYD
ncbi:hypothetical protein B0H13DRAFT_1851230 [Mycena leptocephala]|nr:hypothetical protein B0H13DRAFT_1851230 [Mycena leptocephala]